MGQSCRERVNSPSTAALPGGMKGIRNSSTADLWRNILRLGWSISAFKAWQFLANSGLFKDSSSLNRDNLEEKLLEFPWPAAGQGLQRSCQRFSLLVRRSLEFVTRLFRSLLRERQGKHFNKSWLKLSLCLCASEQHNSSFYPFSCFPFPF